MSDRIGVMNEGRIDQIGTPQDVYETPTTVFVADFLGVANLMSVEAVSSDAGGCELRVGDFRLRACSGDTSARGEAKVVVRPERVEIRAHDGTPPPNCLPGMVDRTIYVGSNLHVVIRLATGALVQASIANTGSVSAYSQGDPVLVHLPDDALRLLTGDGDDAARRTEAVAEDPGGAAR